MESQISTTSSSPHKKNNYCVVSREILESCSLSWEAKGVWAYICSLPSDSTFDLSTFPFKDGNSASLLNYAIKELIEAGYLKSEGDE